MYTYPEALDAMQKLATDYFRKARTGQPTEVRVVADSRTGTASVDWSRQSWNPGVLYVTINMPVRPATYRMSASEFDHWAAYMLHEVGHPLHTDKSVWDAAVKARQHRMLNAVDDVRQEKMTIDMGLAFNAKQAFSALVDSLLVKAFADGYNPNRVSSFGWTIAVLGRAQNGYAVDVSGIWAKLKPMGGVKLCLDWALPRLAKCVTTQDCLDLANEIAAFLARFKGEKIEDDKPEGDKPEGNQPGNRPEPGQGEPVESDDDGEGADDADEAGDAPEAPQGGQNETRGEQPKGEEPSTGDKGSNSGAGKGQLDGEQKPLTDSDFDDVGLQPTSADNMASGTNGAWVQQKVIEIMRDAMESRSKPQPISGRAVQDVRFGSGTNSVEYVAQMSAKMGLQRALLARALKREEEDMFEGGRQHGRFDTRRIARAVQGDPHVFGKRIVSEGYDTDVQILVDGSSSMSGRSIWASSVLAMIVAQAARQVGVDCTAYVFNDSGLHEATKGKEKPSPRKMAYMINQVQGGTPLCENMVKVAHLQQARAKGKRRVLFIITDGGCNNGPEAMREIGKYIEDSMGIEIANLHIGGTPMGVFRNEVAVRVDKVAEVGLKRMTQLLERGAA